MSTRTAPGRPIALLLRRLQRLLLYTESYVSWESPLERALLQYKLGYEVTLPRSRTAKKPAELDLQKELCKFLLERGIHAVGTKFGPSEIDFQKHCGGRISRPYIVGRGDAVDDLLGSVTSPDQPSVLSGSSG